MAIHATTFVCLILLVVLSREGSAKMLRQVSLPTQVPHVTLVYMLLMLMLLLLQLMLLMLWMLLHQLMDCPYCNIQ